MPNLLIITARRPCLILGALMWWIIPLRAQQQYSYAGQLGEHAYDISVRMHLDKDKPVLVLEEEKRYSEHTFADAIGTEKWVLRDEKENHDFTAQRMGNQIHIQGTFQGEAIDKKVTIDDRLWFNKLDHGLSDFATSDQEELSFWVLKLVSDMDPQKFLAEKEGAETIIIQDRTYEAVKVRLTIDNFLLSRLWSAELWYRASDGLFLRYEGVNGGPGTPRTVIELEGRAD